MGALRSIRLNGADFVTSCYSIEKEAIDVKRRAVQDDLRFGPTERGALECRDTAPGLESNASCVKATLLQGKHGNGIVVVYAGSWFG